MALVVLVSVGRLQLAVLRVALLRADVLDVVGTPASSIMSHTSARQHVISVIESPSGTTAVSTVHSHKRTKLASGILVLRLSARGARPVAVDGMAWADLNRAAAAMSSEAYIVAIRKGVYGRDWPVVSMSVSQ